MKNLFTKKEISKVKSMLVDPTQMGEPSTGAEFLRRGMANYARKQFESAEADLRKASILDNSNIDTFYCLGMVYKAMDRKNEAVEAFEQVLNLIRTDDEVDKTKKDMLRRLARGHINEITLGDWNLEKEIWHRIT